MSYFTGPNLRRKVEEYGLEDVEGLLESISDGAGVWPGDLAISVEEEYLESLRIVVYSLIHRYGMKDIFRVKMNINLRQVVITRRDNKVEKKKSDVQVVGQQRQASDRPMPGETLTEDLSGVFDKNISEFE